MPKRPVAGTDNDRVRCEGSGTMRDGTKKLAVCHCGERMTGICTVCGHRYSTVDNYSILIEHTREATADVRR